MWPFSFRVPGTLCEAETTLSGTAEQLAGYVSSPEHVLKYYPDPLPDVAPVTLDDGFILYGKNGTTLIQATHPTGDGDTQVVEVSVAAAGADTSLQTAASVQAAALFTMRETWRFTSLDDTKTRLHKRWHDFDHKRMRMLPMAWIVKRQGLKDIERLDELWSSAD
jgi:hypothetical protein